MIVQERFEISGQPFVRTYSDSGRYVLREGVGYAEACDPAAFGRTYTEGEPMPPEELAAAFADKAEAYDILMGGAS